MLVEMGDGANPGVGGKLVIVEIELPVLVADGGDEACSGRDEARPSLRGMRGTSKVTLLGGGRKLAIIEGTMSSFICISFVL